MRYLRKLKSIHPLKKTVAVEALEPRAYFSVDLTGSISVTAPAAGQVKPGGHAAITIDVTNNGTSPAIGSLDIDLSASASDGNALPLSLGVLNKPLHLQPGAQKSFRVNEKIPLNAAPDTYSVFANIDPASAFGASNVASNMLVSINNLTVLSLFPDLVGTWVGTASIKKGVDKGWVIDQTVYNTSEDYSTGVVSFTGTNYYPNDGVTLSFAGQTTLKANGSFTVIGSDVPADDSGTFRDVGKLVGATSHGTFITAIDSGTFVNAREG